MSNNEIKIGNVVYALHFSNSKQAYLKLCMVVGVYSSLRDSLITTEPEDLIHNLKPIRVQLQPITLDIVENEYSFTEEIDSYSLERELVFESKEAAQVYLQSVIKNIEVIV